MKTLTKEMQNAITPKIALDLLKEGNKRFVNNLKINRNLLQQANETSDGQHPFAVILSCIDSRTSAELIFDQGIGDVFSIRIAGNIVNKDILGSMEFGCKVVGAKAIVVLGHKKCGAIIGACDNVALGNLAKASFVGAKTVKGPALCKVATKSAAFTAATKVVCALEPTATSTIVF